MTADRERVARVKVWDAPTRLVHWCLVLLFGVSWWTGENDALDWHRRSGYAILALILFRVAWGFMGSDTARFSTFLRGPSGVATYVRALFTGRPPGTPTSLGHNPMGGWSVLAMLLMLLLQTGLGLFAVDTDGFESGPLAALVSFDTGRTAAHWHGRCFRALLFLITLHLAAVVSYLLLRRDNLVLPMVIGTKAAPTPPSAIRFASPRRALALVVAVAGLILVVVNLPRIMQTVRG